MKRVFLVALAALLLLCGCTADGENNSEISYEKVYSFDSGVGTFYYPDDIYNNYLTVTREFDGTAQNVIDILYELGNYNQEITVNSYYVQGDTMYIDFGLSIVSAAHGGSAREHFVILGTCNTLMSCFNVTYVRFTVEGEDLVTAHSDYSVPVSFQK